MALMPPAEWHWQPPHWESCRGNLSKGGVWGAWGALQTPEGLGSSVRRRRGWRGGRWFFASLMPGLTITAGNAPRHGSHQGSPISATAGARLGQSPSLGSGAGWREQNVPGRTCGMGKAGPGPGPAAGAVPTAPCRSPARAGSGFIPGGVWGPAGRAWGLSSRAVGYPAPGAGLAVLPLASPPADEHRPRWPGGSGGRARVPSTAEAAAFPDFVLAVYGVSVYSRF